MSLVNGQWLVEKQLTNDKYFSTRGYANDYALLLRRRYRERLRSGQAQYK
ncbi:MAG: hypothetical protein V7K77_22480 [Nostoc sp.]